MFDEKKTLRKKIAQRTLNDSIEFSHTTVPAKAVSRLWASFERRNFLLSALAAEPDGTKVFCYQTFGCFRLSCACLRVLVTGKHRLITDFVDYSRFHVTAAFTKLNLSCFVSRAYFSTSSQM